jgi:ribose 5-phosphate isomerase B
MRIVIASDHGGFELKQVIVKALAERGIEHQDLGCGSADSVDYPRFAHAVAEAVAEGRFDLGVLLCGTGLGVSIAANRHRGVRAALCRDAFTARMARAHNDANVLCLGGRVVGPGLALDILDAFLAGRFEGGRHARRVEAIEL